MSDWRACRVGGRAWSPCPHAWGTLLVVALVCCHDCRQHGACAAHVNHDDDDDSRRCVKHTTLCSCAGWQNVTVCVKCACIVAIDVPMEIVIVAI
jgi:hypothetical protein